jgi:hypothetical protein
MSAVDSAHDCGRAAQLPAPEGPLDDPTSGWPAEGTFLGEAWA